MVIRAGRSSQLSSKQKPGKKKEKKKKIMENFPAAIGARNRLYLTARNYNLGQRADDDCLGGTTAAGWLPAKITAAALVQTPSAGCGVLRTEYLFLQCCLGGERSRIQDLAGNYLGRLGASSPCLTALS